MVSTVSYNLLAVSGGSSERKTAVVPPSVSSSCQFEDLEQLLRHVTPTVPSSGVTSHFQFSPVKSGWSSAPSVDHKKLHSLQSTEFRRDSFPPYVCSALKHSAAVVAPSLARTRSTMPATTLMAQMAASSSVRFPPSALQHLPSTPVTRLFSPRATPSALKSSSDLARRYVESTPVCRTGAGSLLAPSAAAGSGISYSLALSSSLTSSSRPSAGHGITSSFSAGQAHATHLRQLHPTVLSSSNTEQRALFRENTGTRLELRNPIHASPMYNNFHSTLQRTSGATIAVTAISRTTFASTHEINMARYSPYRGLNQISRPACAQYRAGLFTSSSAPSVSSHQHSLQTSGRFIEIT